MSDSGAGILPARCKRLPAIMARTFRLRVLETTVFETHRRDACATTFAALCSGAGVPPASLATIVFSSRAWLFPALALMIGVAAALIWAGHRGEVAARIRVGCGLLKLAGVLTLAVCLLEPLLGRPARQAGRKFFCDHRRQQPEPANQGCWPIAIARRNVCASDSRTTRRAGSRRWRKIFRCGATRSIHGCRDIRDFGELNFAGRASALGKPCATARNNGAANRSPACFLFTDGNATDIGAGFAALDGCPPIYPVVVGAEAGLRDISLDKVRREPDGV